MDFGICPKNQIEEGNFSESRDDSILLHEIDRMLDCQQALLTKIHLRFSTRDRFLGIGISIFCRIRQMIRWNVGAMLILYQKVRHRSTNESVASLYSILEKNAVALDLLERASIVLHELHDGKSHNIYMISNKRLVRKYLKQAEQLAAKANKQVSDFETIYFVPEPRRSLPWIIRPFRFLLPSQTLKSLTE